MHTCVYWEVHAGYVLPEIQISTNELYAGARGHYDIIHVYIVCMLTSKDSITT